MKKMKTLVNAHFSCHSHRQKLWLKMVINSKRLAPYNPKSTSEKSKAWKFAACASIIRVIEQQQDFFHILFKIMVKHTHGMCGSCSKLFVIFLPYLWYKRKITHLTRFLFFLRLLSNFLCRITGGRIWIWKVRNTKASPNCVFWIKRTFILSEGTFDEIGGWKICRWKPTILFFFNLHITLTFSVCSFYLQ